MPLYDYDCAACGRRFEVVHGVHAEPPTSCPLCGKGPIRKAITAPAVHYKGSGWAKKERRTTSSPGASKAGGEGSSTSESNASTSTSDATRGSEGKETGTAAPAASKSAGSDSAGSDTVKTTD
jgi:putative FmdB family regulatory protein